LKEQDINRWMKTIQNCEAALSEKITVWDELLGRYNLDIRVGGMDDDHVTPISRLYPMARKLIATTAYHYPKIFVHMDEGVLLNKFINAGGVLERAANSALKLLGAREEIWQAMFDALFCFHGILKVGHNPRGDEAVAPYVANDDMAEGMQYVRRVDPRNFMVDPLCPPHKMSNAAYVIERMFVPLAFVREDPRFSGHKNKFSPLNGVDEEVLDTAITDIMQDGVDPIDEFQQTARTLQEVVRLYEIHDRVERRRIVFANGIEEPVEDIRHPMLRNKFAKRSHPDDPSRQVKTGEVEETNTFLCPGGFQFRRIKYDMSNEFLGTSMMEYIEPIEQTITESFSRRTDLLKRFSRLLVVSRREKAHNPSIMDSFRDLQDGDVLELEDVERGVRELQWGTVPSDQILLERDAKSYESEIIEVSPGSSSSATEAAIQSAGTEVNREWMLLSVTSTYQWITESMFNMWADARYTPQEFLVNTAQEGEPFIGEILQDWWTEGRWRIDIDTGSMQVLNEKLERNDVIGLYDRLVNRPDVNQKELVKMLGSAFRKQNFEKLMLPEANNVDAVGLAQMENQMMLGGQQPQPQPGQHHNTHMQMHDRIQEAPQFAQLAPEQQQQVMQFVEQHNQAHQQFINQEGGGQGRQSRPSEASKATNLVSLTRSQAQETANAAAALVEPNR
jgi:hypothetical protein